MHYARDPWIYLVYSTGAPSKGMTASNREWWSCPSASSALWPLAPVSAYSLFDLFFRGRHTFSPTGSKAVPRRAMYRPLAKCVSLCDFRSKSACKFIRELVHAPLSDVSFAGPRKSKWHMTSRSGIRKCTLLYRPNSGPVGSGKCP